MSCGQIADDAELGGGRTSVPNGMRKYSVADAILDGNEKTYVLDCLNTGWISGSGPYVRRFEERFADYCGCRHAVAVANGTVALHLALVALSVGPGDEVIVPDLTYIASANAVNYCGAIPVFADVTTDTWTIDPIDVARKITPATRVVMAVHLYGHPAEIDPLHALTQQHDLVLMEDAAEAHGAEYRGRRTGALGTLATFSFFGNKIITTGEGGMVTTDDDDLAQQMRLLRGQGMDPARRYWFPVVGYNYRLTNVQAAIGLAQLERIEWFVERRRQVAAWYQEHLADSDLTLPGEASWAKNVFWLYSVCVPAGIDRDELILQLDRDGIESRPFFHPLHRLPPYFDASGDDAFPISTDLARRGLSLPSAALLDELDVAYICDVIKRSIEIQRRGKVTDSK
jgi:perosamine synthetase